MPTTAQRLIRVAKEPSRFSASDEWQGFLQALNPLVQWESSFAEWREWIQRFRQSEQDNFFPQRNDVFVNHIHRGWLCDLISDGERLAVELLREHPEATDQLQFLNLCLENLFSTLETWHSTQQLDSLESRA